MQVIGIGLHILDVYRGPALLNQLSGDNLVIHNVTSERHMSV